MSVKHIEHFPPVFSDTRFAIATFKIFKNCHFTFVLFTRLEAFNRNLVAAYLKFNLPRLQMFQRVSQSREGRQMGEPKGGRHKTSRH